VGGENPFYHVVDDPCGVIDEFSHIGLLPPSLREVYRDHHTQNELLEELAEDL
jgi:hypothetical protein